MSGIAGSVAVPARFDMEPTTVVAEGMVSCNRVPSVSTLMVTIVVVVAPESSTAEIVKARSPSLAPW